MKYEIMGYDDMEGDAALEELLGAHDEIVGAAGSRHYAAGRGNPQGRLAQPAAARVREYPLGLDSVTTVAAGGTATITQSPQVPFRVERLVVDPSAASAFLISDLKVGKDSQLAAAGNLPATMFMATAVGVTLRGDVAKPGVNIVLSITNFSGAASRFLGGIIGTALD